MTPSTTDPDAGLEERLEAVASEFDCICGRADCECAKCTARDAVTVLAALRERAERAEQAWMQASEAETDAVRRAESAEERAERAEAERDHWTVEHAKATAALEEIGDAATGYLASEDSAGVDPTAIQLIGAFRNRARRALADSPAPEVRDVLAMFDGRCMALHINEARQNWRCLLPSGHEGDCDRDGSGHTAIACRCRVDNLRGENAAPREHVERVEADYPPLPEHEVVSSEDDLAFRLAVQECDRRYHADGAAGTKTWFRDYFVPELARRGFRISRAATPTEEVRDAER